MGLLLYLEHCYVISLSETSLNRLWISFNHFLMPQDGGLPTCFFYPLALLAFAYPDRIVYLLKWHWKDTYCTGNAFVLQASSSREVLCLNNWHFYTATLARKLGVRFVFPLLVSEGSAKCDQFSTACLYGCCLGQGCLPSFPLLALLPKNVGTAWTILLNRNWKLSA